MNRPDPDSPMVEVVQLARCYPGLVALDKISFTVNRGEIVGFLGPNGAGKTTTLRILAGYLAPTSGTARVAGLDVVRDSLLVRSKIGYLPENVALYPDMRVIEYLRFRGALKGVYGRALRVRLDQLMESCGLVDVQRKIIGFLSKGYRQRVGLADSLLNEPDLVILDEPTIGLDPNQIRMIRNLIRSLAPRHTVLLSSHILPEVETVCDRVMIINQGRIVASDTPANLTGLLKGNRCIRAEIHGPLDAVRAELALLPGVIRVEAGNLPDGWVRWVCESPKDMDIRPDIYRMVSRHPWGLRELGVERANLEDVFVQVTRNDAADDARDFRAAGGPSA